MTSPTAHARVGGALLLEDGAVARALVGGARARALVLHAAEAEARLLGGLALALARDAKGSAVAQVHLAALGPDARVVVVTDDPGGVELAQVIEAQARRGGFPWDVACRVALEIAALTRATPHVDDMGVGWDGALRAAPLPRGAMGWHRGPSEGARFLSPEEVRGEQPREATAVYRAGAVAYELLAGVSPLPAEPTSNVIQLLTSIIGSGRVPLAKRRRDLGDKAALVDRLVRPEPGERTPEAVAELAPHACSAGDAARFLAGLLADLFAAARAEDAAFWEEAATLAPDDAPAWRIELLGPVPDASAALRALQNRASRTD